MPVVSKTQGTLSVKPTTGQEHDVSTAQRTREGDTLKTAAGSLADIALADLARMRLGPSTIARVLRIDGGLTLDLTQGGLCVTGSSGQVGVTSGVTLATASAPVIFSVARDTAGTTTLAVYKGEVRTGGGLSARAGQAYTLDKTGAETAVLLSSVTDQLASLQCPDPSVIAEATANQLPLPVATEAPHGGGGGGALGIIGGIALVAAAAGGGGGKGGGSTAPTLALSTNSLTFTSTAGSPQSVTIKGGTAPFTATSCTVAKATVTAAVVSIAPLAVGSCTITVSDSAGNQGPIFVSVVSQLTSSPATLTFTNPSAASQTSIISGGVAPYTLTTGTCPAGASAISAATITVSPATIPANSSCTVTFKDSLGGTGSLTVVLGSAIRVAPASLTFANISAAAQTATISGGKAPYSVSGCSGVAQASIASTTLTVRPQAANSCTLLVADSSGQSAFQVAVVVYGAITFTPASLAFSSPNDTTSDRTITISGGSGTGYGIASVTGCPAGAFSIAGTQVSATPSSLSPSSSCTVTVSDSAGNAKSFNVAVGAFPTLSLTPGSLTFNSRTAGSKTVGISGGNGSYSGTNCSVANVSVNGTTATITPTASGTCNLAITDTAGHNAAVSVDVYPDLAFNPAGPMAFTDPNSSNQSRNFFGGSGTGYTYSGGTCQQQAIVGSVTGGTVTIDPSFVAGGSSCTVVVADSVGNTATLTVTVGALPVTANPSTLYFNNTAAAPQTVSITGGSPGRYTITGCSGLASYTSSLASPGATLSVTPANPTNSCTLTIRDPAGTTATVTVTIYGPVSATPNHLGFNHPTDANQSVTISGGNGSYSLNNGSCATGAVSIASPTITIDPSFIPPNTVNCTVGFKDSVGNTGTFTVSVGAYTGITFAPTTLTLANPGASGSVTVSGGSGTGYTASGTGSTCSNVTVTGTTVTVGPTAAGSCNAIVKDSVGTTGTLAVTVAGYSAIAFSPSTLTLASPSASGSVTVSGGTGTGYAIGSGGTCANTSISSGTHVNVGANPAGSCTVDVKDSANNTGTLDVTVNAFGAIAFAPSSLTLANPSASGSVTVSGGSGTGYTASGTGSTCGNVTVTGTTVSVGPNAASCTVIVKDSANDSGTLNVTVGGYSGLTASPKTLTISVLGSGGALQFTATEDNFPGGVISATIGSCANASVSPASQALNGNSATFTVTPAGSIVPGTCTVTITDPHQGSDTVTVIAPGPMSVDQSAIDFTAVSSPQNVIVTDSNAGNNTISADSAACSSANAASVTPTSQAASAGQATFSVTAGTTPSACTITFSDALGNTATVSIDASAPASARRRRFSPIGLRAPAPTSNAATSKLVPSETNLVMRRGDASATKTISVVEPGYTGAFTISNSRPDIATASLVNSGPGSAQITVTARAGGTALLTVTDANGNVLTIPVTVSTGIRGTGSPIRRQAPDASGTGGGAAAPVRATN